MKINDLITQNKSKILPELIDWIETFNPRNMIYNRNTIKEDEEEKMHEDYKYLSDIIERFESDLCSNEDFEVIIFQIKQINYEEEIIKL